MDDATGKAQATAAIYLSKKWPVEKSLVSVGLDTTTSNTGLRQGSVIRIEQELQKRLLWLSCRHHMYELHIKHAFTKLFGERSGPDDLLFKSFQSIWPDLDKDTNDLGIYCNILYLLCLFHDISYLL